MNGMLPSVGILMIGRWIKEDADMLTWEFNRTGVFDTHSYYHALRASIELSFGELKLPGGFPFLFRQQPRVGF